MSFLNKNYRIAVALLIAGLACSCIQAQDTPVTDVAAGYSFFYVVKGFTLANNGASGSVTFNANSWLGLAGDFGNISPGPIILMPVSSQDPRLGTRPAWILYVTLADMRRVLQVLDRASLSWKGSPNPKQLVVSAFELPHPHHDSMEVAATTSTKSAIAEVVGSNACNLLSDLSSELTNANARDSFAFYRRTVSCLPPEKQTISK